jgi:hypothetical protein
MVILICDEGNKYDNFDTFDQVDNHFRLVTYKPNNQTSGLHYKSFPILNLRSQITLLFGASLTIVIDDTS